MSTIRTAPLLLTVLLTLAGCGAVSPHPQGVAEEKVDPKILAYVDDLTVADPGDHVLVFDTTKGMIAINLRNLRAPITTAAIEKLVHKKFFNGLSFYRVEKDYIIQTGDPSNGTAPSTGQPKVPLEINADLSNGIAGAVGMSRSESDKNDADSRIYILLRPQPSLDNIYAVFGYVIKGMEVAQKIEKGDIITSAVLIRNIPTKPASSVESGGPSVPEVPAR